jgi:hypothetical protein
METIMKLICKLIGHSFKQYLQLTTDLFEAEPVDDNETQEIYKKIVTNFVCKRCFNNRTFTVNITRTKK